MSSDDAHLVSRFFPGTGSTYDVVVRRTTLHLDDRWKRRLIARIPPNPTRILDLACGTGILTYRMLRTFPGLHVVGVDATEDYLAVARARQRASGAAATFLHGDAQTVPVTAHGPFDAIVSSYIPKYVDADRLIANVTPALRPGGRIVLHDFTYPRGPIPRIVWHGYFAALDPMARHLWPVWGRVFDTTLTRLIRRTRWVSEFREALARAGYVEFREEPLTFRAATVVSARRPAAPSRNGAVHAPAAGPACAGSGDGFAAGLESDVSAGR